MVWLPSGWWVTLRHEFAAAKTGAAIVGSAAVELSEFTARLTNPRGEAASALAVELEDRRFHALGPPIWLGHD